jgi:hypothetical protein
LSTYLRGERIIKYKSAKHEAFRVKLTKEAKLAMLLAPLVLILLGILNDLVSATPVPLNGPTVIQQHSTSTNPAGPSAFEAGLNGGK